MAGASRASSAIVAVAGGNEHSLALSANGVLWAWGSNGTGNLGSGDQRNRARPAIVPGLPRIRAIGNEQQGDEHALALAHDGRVWSWGRGSEGQLGDGRARDRSTPARIPGLPRIIDVAAGQNHAYALAKDGRVYAWGDNAEGQLGDGSQQRSAVPIAVPALRGVLAIAGGGDAHSLAIGSDRKVWSWGSNADGQLGSPEPLERSLRPLSVGGITAPIQHIAAGGAHSLALDVQGQVWAWGLNSNGQLGHGRPLASSPVPVLLTLPRAAVAIAGGQLHSLALLEDGTVLAWGAGELGQLGNGRTVDSSLPVPVASLVDIVAIAAGDSHSLAVGASGQVWSWGANGSGQLGDGTRTDVSAPVAIVFGEFEPGSP